MKSVIIFASPGGGGHIANARAIKAFLSEHPEAIEIDIVDHWSILGLSHMVHIYNFCLKYNLIGFYEFIIRPFLQFVGKLAQSEKWLPNILSRYLDELPKKPDLIISNSPILNNVIGRAIKLAWPENMPPFLILILDPVDYRDPDMRFITAGPQSEKGRLQAPAYFQCCTDQHIRQVR